MGVFTSTSPRPDLNIFVPAPGPEVVYLKLFRTTTNPKYTRDVLLQIYHWNLQILLARAEPNPQVLLLTSSCAPASAISRGASLLTASRPGILRQHLLCRESDCETIQ